MRVRNSNLQLEQHNKCYDPTKSKKEEKHTIS